MLMNSDQVKTGWWQVYLTGALVFVGLLTMIFTCRQMKREIDSFEKVSLQASRPLVVITPDSSLGILLGYQIGKIDTTLENPIDFRLLASVPLRSDAYKAATAVKVGFMDYSINITNAGRTPLYLNGIMFGVKNQREWVTELQKDAAKLCLESSTSEYFVIHQTDFVILPDSTVLYRKQERIRTISLSDFAKYRDSTHSFPMYPYVYLQYKDPYDNVYDALWMLVCIFHVDTTRNSEQELVAEANLYSIAIEKLRWDVLYEN